MEYKLISKPYVTWFQISMSKSIKMIVDISIALAILSVMDIITVKESSNIGP